MAVRSPATARSGVYLGDGRFRVEERAVGAEPGQMVVRVLAAGICGTDLAITARPPQYAAASGAVLGHEIYGAVLDADGRQRETVIVDPNLYCGRCERCLLHQPTHCRMKELTVCSAFIGNGQFAVARDLITTGVIAAEEVVTAVCPLEQISDAFDNARGGRGLKVGIEP